MSNRSNTSESIVIDKPGFWTAWKTFWFAPRQTLGLHAIRILFGILLLCWLVPFAGYVDDFFGMNGWFDQAAFAEANQPGGELIDSQSWSLLYLVAKNGPALHAFYWSSLAVIVLFTLGFFTRITGVLTWLIVVSFTANPLIEVDTDVFMRMIAFYLMIAYLMLDLLRLDMLLLLHIVWLLFFWVFPVWLLLVCLLLIWLLFFWVFPARRDRTGDPYWQHLVSWNHWVGAMLKTKENSHRSSAATVVLRLLQVHFALAMVMMGLYKLQVAEWWGGVTFWYPMHRPGETTLEAINALRAKSESYLMFISIASYLVIIWQVFFPTFAWRGGLCRWILLGGALAGTVGLMVIYPIPLMGPVFLLLCLTYLADFEWFRIFSPLQRLVKG